MSRSMPLLTDELFPPSDVESTNKKRTDVESTDKKRTIKDSESKERNPKDKKYTKRSRSMSSSSEDEKEAKTNKKPKKTSRSPQSSDDEKEKKKKAKKTSVISDDERTTSTSSKKRTHSSSSQNSSARKNKTSATIKPIPTPSRLTAKELFGSDSEQEVETPQPSAGTQLQSVFVNRIASGLSKQVIPEKPGSHYVELKVYRCSDIEGVSPINRWRHAVTAIKYRTDTNSVLWQHLANVVNAARKDFRGVPNTFSSYFSLQ